MTQKFFENTIESQYIKEFLCDNYAPVCNTVTDGDTIIAGHTYVYKSNIIKCTSTGILRKNILGDSESAGSSDLSDNNLYSDATAVYVGKFNQKYWYPNNTQNFISNTNYYDSDTHKALGKYLRYVRDVKGIDLMPFYNCVNCDTVTDIELGVAQTTDGTKDFYNSDWKMSSPTVYKTFAVPVLFNKIYTIALDCDRPVLIKPVIYGYYGMETTTINGELKYLTDILNKPALLKSNSQFKQSFTVDTSMSNVKPIEGADTLSLLASFEANLKLLIQVPIGFNSSLVVIEGDYNNNFTENHRYTIDWSCVNKLNNSQKNAAMISRLSLLEYNDKIIHPYSPRLIEYLVGTTVDSTETIPDNIIDAGITAGVVSRTDVTPDDGVWKDRIRYKLFKKSVLFKPSRTMYDINGFMDKDIENYIYSNYIYSKTARENNG